MNDGTIGNQQRSLEVRLSWFGGILDGEGTISFASKYSKTSRQKNYHFRPELKLDNTNALMVEEIRSILDIVGCGYYVRDYKSPSKINDNWKQATRIIVDGVKRLQKFLPIMIPYLVSKREQAELVLQYIESRLAGGHKAVLTAEQEALILKVRQLNHRGLLNRPETIRRTPVLAGDDVVRPPMRVGDVGRNDQRTAVIGRG